MNLILLSPKQVDDQQQARIVGRQFEHIVKTLNAQVGDTLSIGIENSTMGHGKLIALKSDHALIQLTNQFAPPKALPLKLVLAMPRPKMLRRTLHSCISMGIKEIVLLNSWKVEKSYWQTPWLKEQALYETSVLALEQAKDTILPCIQIRKLFKPFIEDELREFSKDTQGILAHPGSTADCPINTDQATTLVIGPEGGFTAYEVEKIREQGFEAVNIGERILRVETAVPALISRLYPS
jgi:RsmE family RNA methyltransferase